MDAIQGEEDTSITKTSTMKIITPGRIKVTSGSKDFDGTLMKNFSTQLGHHSTIHSTFVRLLISM